MTIEQTLTFAAFFVFAGITLIGGWMVATLRNVMHAALALMLALFGVAGLYILLDAGFIAAVQVLVYIGAITVLILFAIMLTRGLMTKTLASDNNQWIAAGALSALLFVALVVVSLRTRWPLGAVKVGGDSIAKLGAELMTTYVLPFEVVSLVLLAALIGAIVIARE